MLFSYVNGIKEMVDGIYQHWLLAVVATYIIYMVKNLNDF